MAVIVPNARNAAVLIDECDADRVLALRWTVFPAVQGWQVAHQFWRDKRLWRRPLSRFVMEAPDGIFVDHINGNRLDNTRANLRLASARENSRNSRKQDNCLSAFKGVCASIGKAKPWRAYIYDRKRQIHLGCHPTEEAAALAYDAAARELFGEFAALNFPVAGEQGAHRSSHHFVGNNPEAPHHHGD